MASDHLEKTWNESQKLAAGAALKAQRLAVQAGRDLGELVNESSANGLDAAREALHKAGASLTTAADRGRITLDELADDGAGMLRRGGRTMSAAFTRRPLEALLLAGAVGYLIGFSIPPRD
jgi:hypothetical protein